jgi:hypothetical protein
MDVEHVLLQFFIADQHVYYNDFYDNIELQVTDILLLMNNKYRYKQIMNEHNITTMLKLNNTPIYHNIK